jgi:hypothetical protein
MVRSRIAALLRCKSQDYLGGRALWSLLMPLLIQIKDTAATSSFACETLRKFSLRTRRAFFNAKRGRFWVFFYTQERPFAFVCANSLMNEELCGRF